MRSWPLRRGIPNRTSAPCCPVGGALVDSARRCGASAAALGQRFAYTSLAAPRFCGGDQPGSPCHNLLHNVFGSLAKQLCIRRLNTGRTEARRRGAVRDGSGAPQQVHLCGSFTRWVETVPMAAMEGSPGVYSVVVHLPPGCAPAAAPRRCDSDAGAACSRAASAAPREGARWGRGAQSEGARARRYHQYKFIVDGEWRHDETQPFMPDPLGNVNNWLFVRRPETQTQQGGCGPVPCCARPGQALLEPRPRQSALRF